MKTQTSKLSKIAAMLALLGTIAFIGFAFKPENTSVQIMTLLPLQSKTPMKGDQDLCLIVDGNVIEKIALPSAHSTKLEDQLAITATINKTLNRLSKEGWKVISTDGYMRVILLSK